MEVITPAVMLRPALSGSWPSLETTDSLFECRDPQEPLVLDESRLPPPSYRLSALVSRLRLKKPPLLADDCLVVLSFWSAWGIVVEAEERQSAACVQCIQLVPPRMGKSTS